MIDAHGVTHPGRVRTINEDALLADEALRLFVVADGMGGHNAGDVASRIAVETVRAFLVRSQDQAECTWPYGIDSRVSLDANRLLTALKVANRKVFRAADAAVLAGDDSLCFGSVGDSRLYAHGAGTLAQLTEDDSWLASIAAADATLTEEQKATHPMRHVLTKALGATPTIGATPR
jgi:protein phosphatase